MTKQEEILLELIKNNVEVQMIYNLDSPTKITYLLGGFYKSSTCALTPAPGGERFNAMTRYGHEQEITSVEDIVAYNFYWWERSRDRTEIWSIPSQGWDNLLLEFGFVRRRTETVTHYEIMDK